MSILQFQSLEEAERAGFQKVITPTETGNWVVMLENVSLGDPPRAYGDADTQADAERRALASLNANLRMQGVEG